MKILHTSDWHLGQHFYRFDRDEEHRDFFSQLAVIVQEEQPDALLVSGDIFDSAAPSVGAQHCFVRGVVELHEACPACAIFITAGNHDSGSRLDVHKPLWKEIGVTVTGSCVRQEDGTFDPEQFVFPVRDKGIVVAVPYFHPTNFPPVRPDLERDERQRTFFGHLLSHAAKQNGAGRPVLLMAHLAVEGSDLHGHEERLTGGMEKERLETLGSGYDYLALGHIHKPQSVTGRVRYSGSPLPMSFDEDYRHTVSIVEIARHGDLPAVREREITPLRPVKTLPARPADLETALQELAALAESDPSYVRLLVDQEGLLPPDAEQRAMSVVKEKQCRFCEVRKVHRREQNDPNTATTAITVEEIRAIPPLEIARRYVESKFGHPLNEELTTLMKEVIEEVRQEQP